MEMFNQTINIRFKNKEDYCLYIISYLFREKKMLKVIKVNNLFIFSKHEQ